MIPILIKFLKIAFQLSISLEYIGLTHIGVVKCLFEQKLLPRIISGASVGSIIAAVVCTRTDPELTHLLDPKNIGDINLNVFEDPVERGNVLIKIARFLKHCKMKDGLFLLVSLTFSLSP